MTRKLFLFAGVAGLALASPVYGERGGNRADRAQASDGMGPVVLADLADNPGAGAPGDGTHLLARLLERGVGDCVIGALPDPEAVAAAIAAGPGRWLRLRLGGKVDPRGGPPLDLVGRVRALSEGVFVNSGPMGRGSISRMGRTALLA